MSSPIAYQRVIVLSWAACLLVWGLLAFRVKPDVRGPGFASAVWRSLALRLAVVMLLVVLAARLAARADSSSGNAFSKRVALFTAPPLRGWLAAALTVIGIGLAIWARFCLGRNWSPRPAVKERPELVTSGPYAVIRHPIYAGVLLAALGAALTGTIFGFILVAVIGVVFLTRIGQEEKIMRGLFPNDYPAYQARTKRLIPFVW